MNKNNLISKSNFINFIAYKYLDIMKGIKMPYKFNFKIILYLIIILLLVFIIICLEKDYKYKKIEYLINNNENNSFSSNKKRGKNKIKYYISYFYLKEQLLKKINETYEKNGFVNINQVESTIPYGREWKKWQNKSKEINVGAAFDTKYILMAMFTMASVIDSQNLETKLRLHFALVDGFSAESMIKIYTLRRKIRDDVEFNFYNAKKVETDLKNTNKKGNAINAKLILPELLSDDINRIIILDVGDTIVLEDLSEMYNWNMEDKIFYGVIDASAMKYGPISKKILYNYINTGCFLVDVKKAKSEKIYKKIVENKNLYKPSIIVDQDYLNDVSYGKIGILPIKFGLTPYQTILAYIKYAKLTKNYQYLKNNEINSQNFNLNPVIIHQWNGKWVQGKGLTIYRRIAQYYIRFAGIWDEMCKEHPGACKKQKISSK